MAYTVVFTPEAEAQLIELYGYIAAEASRRHLRGSRMALSRIARA